MKGSVKVQVAAPGQLCVRQGQALFLESLFGQGFYVKPVGCEERLSQATQTQRHLNGRRIFLLCGDMPGQELKFRSAEFAFVQMHGQANHLRRRQLARLIGQQSL